MSQAILSPAQPQSLISRTELISRLMRLVIIGVCTQLIYVAYIVAFPLISNTQAGGPAADLEILMRGYRWFAPIYTAGIVLLYILFWQTMKLVSGIRVTGTEGQGESGKLQVKSVDLFEHRTAHPVSPFTYNRLKLFILGFGLLFGFTLIWLYPITANDIYRYVLRGRIWAVYGESPMLVPPNAFSDDPYIAFAGEFGDWPSGYGPLWEVAAQVPMRLGATEIVAGTVGMKLLVFLAYGICAGLIGWLAVPERGSSLMALTFFAWNPLVLMQTPGNGHNDMLFMALMVLGLILWQRKLWWAAVVALTLSALAKASALIIIPLFAVVLLRGEPTWRQRIFKGVGAGLIGLVLTFSVYTWVSYVGTGYNSIAGTSLNRLQARCSQISEPAHSACLSIVTSEPVISIYNSTVGPTVDSLQSVSAMLTSRRGFAIASGLRMVLREIIPQPIAEPLPRTIGRYIFILFYLWLLVQLWRNKLNLVTAAFLAYFSQLMFGRTFRIWYPIWLIPLTALYLTPALFWRAFLFSLTAELSIINYFVVWRWWLRDFNWGKVGPLSQYWNYWTMMHVLTVPWLFGIPLFGPIIMRRMRQTK